MDIARIPSDGITAGDNWGDLFFHPRFVNAAADIFKIYGQPVVLSSEGSPVFVLNLLSRSIGPFKTATIPLLFQYFGAISLKTGLEGKDVVALNDYLSGFCDFALFSFPPGFPVEPLRETGWNLRKTMTLALYEDDLRTWGLNFRDDVKNKIRKAEKNGVEVDRADAFPAHLWELAYERKGLSAPVNSKSLARWCDRLISDSKLRIFAARKNGLAVAFRGELISGKYAYDWIAGSDPDYHAVGVNQLLMMEIGKSLGASGVRTWDLVGGEIKSIYDFKKSFGAKEAIHFQGEKYFNLKGRIFCGLRRFKYGR